MDVFCQRLDQEFNAQVVVTSPSVSYKVKIKGAKNIKAYGGEIVTINNPLLMPDVSIIEEYYEPRVLATIITPDVYLNEVSSLCMVSLSVGASHHLSVPNEKTPSKLRSVSLPPQSRRGVQKKNQNIDQNTVMLQVAFPLNEIIVNFFDELKSITSGYASFDYEETGYELTSLAKVRRDFRSDICMEYACISSILLKLFQSFAAPNPNQWKTVRRVYTNCPYESGTAPREMYGYSTQGEYSTTDLCSGSPGSRWKQDPGQGGYKAHQ